MVLVELVWHDVRTLSNNLVLHFVLLADDCGSGVQLTQIVHHCILDVNVYLRKHVIATLILLHRDVCET